MISLLGLRFEKIVEIGFRVLQGKRKTGLSNNK